ncbi:hypothetical protein V7161_23975 [Neobacillus drentensis]
MKQFALFNWRVGHLNSILLTAAGFSLSGLSFIQVMKDSLDWLAGGLGI